MNMRLNIAVAFLALGSIVVESAYLSLTDSIVNEAVDLYFSDPSTSTSIFGPIDLWDVSRVTNTSFLFKDRSTFEADLSNWNVARVTNMSHMFDGASIFNSNLSQWKTSKVTNMTYMFGQCSNFNSDLSKWQTSRVLDMQYMFVYASAFNADLSQWDVSRVTALNGMFWEASSFSNLGVSLNKWKTSNCEYFDYMFYHALSFNQKLCWDTSKSLDPPPPLSHVFEGAGSDSQFLSYPACTKKVQQTKAPAPPKPTKAPAPPKPTKAPVFRSTKKPKRLLLQLIDA